MVQRDLDELSSKVSKTPTTLPTRSAPRPFVGWEPLAFGGLALVSGAVVGLATSIFPNPLFLLAGVVGMGFAFASLGRPELGLLMLVWIIYTRLSDVLVHTYGAPSIAKPYTALMILVVVGRWFFFDERPKGWQRAFIVLFAWGIAIFPSLLYAADPYRVQGVISDFVKDGIIVVVIVVLLQRGITFRRVIWVLLATGIFMGTISTIQQMTGTFEQEYWGYGQARVENIAGEEEDYRIAGPIGNANFYGQILVVLVPLALDRLWHEKKLLWRLVAAWALAVCVLSILFTFSRSSLIGMILAIVFLFVRRPPGVLSLFIMVLIASQLLTFMPKGYTDRIMTLTEFFEGDVRNEVSFRGRASETKAAIMMFQEHPFLGVGVANYPVHYQEYSRKIGLDSRRGERHPHSLYLEIASEQGFLGLAALLILVGTLLLTLYHAEQELIQAGEQDLADMTVALMAGMVGYFVIATWNHNAYPRFLWLLVGISMATQQVARTELLRWKQSIGENRN